MLWLSRQEKLGQPLAPIRLFLWRLGRNFLASLGVVLFSLTVGTLGYHHAGGCDWLDSFMNACMILTGMGPVTPMTTTAGKFFASFYALYSGLAFLTMMALLLTPLCHRMLHHFHLNEEDSPSDKPSARE